MSKSISYALPHLTHKRTWGMVEVFSPLTDEGNRAWWLPCDPGAGAQEGPLPPETPRPLCCFPPGLRLRYLRMFSLIHDSTAADENTRFSDRVRPGMGGKNERNYLFVPHPRIGPPGKHSFLIEICWKNIYYLPEHPSTAVAKIGA